MTATMIENDLDTPLIYDLDFDQDEACELEEECTERAEYKIQMNCCGQVYVSCEEHLFWLHDTIKNEESISTCLRCNTWLIDGVGFSVVGRV